jgi:hypothetical protein
MLFHTHYSSMSSASSASSVVRAYFLGEIGKLTLPLCQKHAKLATARNHGASFSRALRMTKLRGLGDALTDGLGHRRSLLTYLPAFSARCAAHRRLGARAPAARTDHRAVLLLDRLLSVSAGPAASASALGGHPPCSAPSFSG